MIDKEPDPARVALLLSLDPHDLQNVRDYRNWRIDGRPMTSEEVAIAGQVTAADLDTVIQMGEEEIAYANWTGEVCIELGDIIGEYGSGMTLGLAYGLAPPLVRLRLEVLSATLSALRDSDIGKRYESRHPGKAWQS